MTIRVVYNQKGGVGKSSIAANLAAISAALGVETLLVDLDPQGNSSHYLLAEAYNDAAPDMKDFFDQMLSFQIKPVDPSSYCHPTDYPNLSVMPSNPELGDLQAKLESKHKIYKLRDALQQLASKFEVIIIDTPPAFNFFSLSALIAADKCLIPFDCDEFARQALYGLLANVEETKQDHNHSLSIEGVVVNQFQPRASLPAKIVEALKADSLPVLESYLPSSVKMKESHQQCCPLIHMAPKHKLTLSFIDLHQELNRQ